MQNTTLWDRGEEWEVLKISLRKSECDIDLYSDDDFDMKKFTIWLHVSVGTSRRSRDVHLIDFFRKKYLLDFVSMKYDTRKSLTNFESYHWYVENNDITCMLT